MKELTTKELLNEHFHVGEFVWAAVFFLIGLFVCIGIPIIEGKGSGIANILFGMLLLTCTIGIAFIWMPAFAILIPMIRNCLAIRKGDFTISYDTISQIEQRGVSRRIYMRKYSKETGKIFPTRKKYVGRANKGDGAYLIYIHGQAKKCKSFFLAHEWKLSLELATKME